MSTLRRYFALTLVAGALVAIGYRYARPHPAGPPFGCPPICTAK